MKRGLLLGIIIVWWFSIGAHSPSMIDRPFARTANVRVSKIFSDGSQAQWYGDKITQVPELRAIVLHTDAGDVMVSIDDAVVEVRK